MTLEEATRTALSTLSVAYRAEQGSRWQELARPEQKRPEGCREFIIMGGRGSGKTRAGAEDCLQRCRDGGEGFIAHATAPTVGDAIGTLMDGPSGVKACAMPGEIVRTKYDKSNLLFELANGSSIRFFGMDEPDRLNGPQCHHWWSDEFGLTPVASLDMANLGNRLMPSTFCGTSTPKQRPGTKHVLSLFPDAVIRRMRMQDNRANLDPNFIAAVERRYAGTRLALAEIEGQDVEDVEGALWRNEWFDRAGFRRDAALFREDGQLKVRVPANIWKIVVALDPTVSDPEKKKNPNKEPDACGVIVAGVDEIGWGHVLYDGTAVMRPEEWARLALRLYSLFRANEITAEANQGGELIKETIKAYGTANVQLVHASVGKRMRHEPVAMFYEQGRVHHYGDMKALEDQMTSWDAADPSLRSPNNVDALTVAFHGLGLCDMTGGRVHKTINTRGEDDDDD